MRFEVETAAQRRTIEIQRAGSGWAVQVDGRRLWVDLARHGDRWSMLVRHAASDDGIANAVDRVHSSHEFAVEPQRSGTRLVHVDGQTVAVTLGVPRQAAIARGAAAGATGPVAIAAPMPGRVVKLLVGPGQIVAARQGVVVVEAMKMENELRTPHAGRVVEVRAREGDPVEANVVLVVIEPH